MAEMTRRTHIHYQTLWDWKTGRTTPTKPLVRLCAMVLDMDEDRLRRAIEREAALQES